MFITCKTIKKKKPVPLFKKDDHKLSTPVPVNEVSVIQEELNTVDVGGKVKVHEKIGFGAHGSVFIGQVLETGLKLAVKKIKNHCAPHIEKYVDRELEALKALKHDNIVRMYSFAWPNEGDVLVLFLELCQCNLWEYICHLHTQGEHRMEDRVIKSFLQQILGAVAYIHDTGFIHRDLKTTNILMDNSGRIKVADFGSARPLAWDKDFDPEDGCFTGEVVCTIPYCSPEYLLGSRHYGAPLDMWSVGVVLHDMMDMRGMSISGSIHKYGCLISIFMMAGTPTEESWPGVTSLPYYDPLFPKFRTDWSKVGLDEESPLKALCKKMLVPCPAKRITAADALAELAQHPAT